MDSSEAMLAQARRRFWGDQETVFELADYTRAVKPWGEYDAVVSALSIHHLPDAEKQSLFRTILSALKPGGVFVNAEQILQRTEALEMAARAQWLEQVRALGATEEQIASSLLRQREDRCATVADQLQWMKEAGFRESSCEFAEERFAVLLGRRDG